MGCLNLNEIMPCSLGYTVNSSLPHLYFQLRWISNSLAQHRLKQIIDEQFILKENNLTIEFEVLEPTKRRTFKELVLSISDKLLFHENSKFISKGI